MLITISRGEKLRACLLRRLTTISRRTKALSLEEINFSLQKREKPLSREEVNYYLPREGSLCLRRTFSTISRGP
jgi:hypothetical protein